jgi:hypothetical protein
MSDTPSEAVDSSGSAEPPPGRWQKFWRATAANPTAVAALASATAALLGVVVTLVTFTTTANQTEQAQYADRYTRAVAQLGDPALEVRLGGIYALERLAKDSHRDQPTVVNVLAAYARNHLPFANAARLQVDNSVSHGGDVPLIGSDVAASIDALERRDRAYDDGSTASLARACLPGSFILSGRDLHGFNFAFANLDHANLTNTNLSGDTLVGADLVGAELAGANLDEADVGGAYMQGAKGVALTDAKGRPATPPSGQWPDLAQDR